MPFDTSTSSCPSGLVLVPSDVTVYSNAIRAVYIGGAGDLSVRMVRGGPVLPFRNVPVGTLLPICVDMVMATGTTATFLIGLGS